MIKIIIHDREDLENLMDFIQEICAINDAYNRGQTKLDDFDAS
jgi:hypothetical protein